MAITDQVKRRIEEFAKALSQELGEVDASQGTCWLDAIENQSLAISDAVHAALVHEQAANPAVDSECLCPKCGRPGRYTRSRQRKLITQRGPTTISEPECYCPACRRAFFPSDPRDRG